MVLSNEITQGLKIHISKKAQNYCWAFKNIFWSIGDKDIVLTLLLCCSFPAETFNLTRGLLAHQCIHVIVISINGVHMCKLMRSKFFLLLSTRVLQVLSWEKPWRAFFYLAITNIVDLASKITGFHHNIIFHFELYWFAIPRKESKVAKMMKNWKFHRLLSDILIMNHIFLPLGV